MPFKIRRQGARGIADWLVLKLTYRSSDGSSFVTAHALSKLCLQRGGQFLSHDGQHFCLDVA